MEKKSKILIVDDSPASFVVFEAIFDAKKYELHQALSGCEALELTKLHQYDLLLVNVQMPVMDGFEAVYHIRKNVDYLNTPVLFVTAFDRDQVFARSPQHMIQEEFIFKPFHPEKVLSRVGDILAQKALSH